MKATKEALEQRDNHLDKNKEIEELKTKELDLEQTMKIEGRDRYLGRNKSMKTASMQNEPHVLISKAIDRVSRRKSRHDHALRNGLPLRC